MLEEDQLLEIANDGGLESIFETTSNLHTFWIQVEYVEIAKKALKILLPFPTSYLYLCVTGLSLMTATKTRLQSGLDTDNTLHVSLPPITPRWDCLVIGKQAPLSH